MAIKLPDKLNTRDVTVSIVKNDINYVLPLTSMNKDASSTNMKLEGKAFNHGSIVTGFNKIAGRNIELSTYIEADSETDYLKQMRDLKRHIYMGDYRLYISENRYFNIKGVSKFSAKDYDGFIYRRADIDITLLAADPFEYTGRSYTEVIEATDGLAFELGNVCNIDAPLIVKITPTAGAPEISLANTTYDRKFIYKDPNLINPAILTVNTRNGAVTVDNINRINNFSGAFLSMAPGLNQFVYTGADAEIEVIYEERYI